MTNILDGLIARIDDPATRDTLASEADRLRGMRAMSCSSSRAGSIGATLFAM
jgi:hypothetical protein